MEKLFIITRQDLEPGAQAAQLVHAALLFAQEHPEITLDWFEGSNNIVLLATKNEAELEALMTRAIASKITCSAFKEPDFDNALTSLAIEPDGYRIVSSIPLALKRTALQPTAL